MVFYKLIPIFLETTHRSTYLYNILITYSKYLERTFHLLIRNFQRWNVYINIINYDKPVRITIIRYKTIALGWTKLFTGESIYIFIYFHEYVYFIRMSLNVIIRTTIRLSDVCKLNEFDDFVQQPKKYVRYYCYYCYYRCESFIIQHF